MDESPSVLSVGKKCVEEGYSFVWPANGIPYMISPDNKKIVLEVEGNIPYIVKDSDFCTPMVDEQTENISKMITGHIDVGYQPEIVDYDVDPQGFKNCDADDQPCIPQKRKRRRRKKRDPSVPGEAEEEEREDPEEIEEAADEDDADDLEVDVVDGASRMVRRGTRKAEARTIQHLLTHRYRNPYFESCIRAKMRHYKTHRGAFNRRLKAFGDLVTFDFIDVQRIMDQGIHTDREIFVIRDRYTGIIWAYPSMEKFTSDVITAVNHFKGLRKIKIAYADKAPEFEVAMKKLKIPFDHSLPHHPQNNGKEQPIHHDNHYYMLARSGSTTMLLESCCGMCQ